MLDNDLSVAGIHHLNIHSLKNAHHYQPEKNQLNSIKSTLSFKFALSSFSSRSKNTGPVSKDHFKSYQMRNETPLHL